VFLLAYVESWDRDFCSFEPQIASHVQPGLSSQAKSKLDQNQGARPCSYTELDQGPQLFQTQAFFLGHQAHNKQAAPGRRREGQACAGNLPENRD
jgi:hypothetical protein